MKEGLYKVTSWDGKDGILVDDAGEFVTVSRPDLPTEAKGRLIPDEMVRLKLVLFLEPTGHLSREMHEDDLARMRFLRERNKQIEFSEKQETPVQVVHRGSA